MIKDDNPRLLDARRSVDECLETLSTEQKAQVLQQIRYHLGAPPHVDVVLNDVVSMRLQVGPGVTRPMSSKGLAQWLWAKPKLFYRRSVLDMGTGCGIQGITCLLGGCECAVLCDVTSSSVECAARNVKGAGLAERSRVVRSDLFEAMTQAQAFDLMVFAQPYFAGLPLPEFEFTRGMLDPGQLLNRFFSEARKFLKPSGCIVMMGWKFAGPVNDPASVGRAHGYEVLESYGYKDPDGIQCGSFEILVLG